MGKLLEPYVKEKNLIQLPIFTFEKKKQTEMVVKWDDKNGEYELMCSCKYGVPGAFEQDVYAACMRIWVKQDMPDKIKLTYSDIARELEMRPESVNVKIKKALKKLAMARYEFKGCFIKDGKRENTYFSLFDKASLFDFDKTKKGKSRRNSESILVFPDDIKENIEAKYYQFLDMAWYRSLPSGLPRRMYEYLDKRRYHASNNIFSIAEDTLMRWMSIKDSKKSRARKKIKDTAHCLINAGYLSKYKYEKDKKACIFIYKDKLPKQEQQQLLFDDLGDYEGDNPKVIDAEVVTSQTKVDDPKPKSKDQEIGSLEYLEALQWIDTIKYFHKKRKQEISDMPIVEIAKVYKGIRREYESKDKKPSAGWVYKAFMEGWEFATEIEEPETPEANRAKKAKDIFESWSKEEQCSFMQELRNYIGPSMDDDKVDEFIQSDKVWFSWAPMLMAAKGLFDL